VITDSTSLDYWERVLGIKVSYNLEEFKAVFKSIFNQATCKSLIPKVQSHYLIHEHIANAIPNDYRYEKPFVYNTEKYRLIFERNDINGVDSIKFDHFDIDRIGSGYTYYDSFVTIMKDGRDEDKRRVTIRVQFLLI
jgi:hypothetical protein